MNRGKFIALGATAAFLLSTTAYAATPREMLNQLEKCAEISDATQRLACYDAQAPQLRESMAAIKKPTERTAEEQATLFGFDIGGIFDPLETPAKSDGSSTDAPQSDVNQGPVIDSISAGVSDYSLNPLGKFVVFLDNGQVWLQIGGGNGTPRFQPKDNKVVISRAIFGSFNLKLNDEVGFFKVRRIK